MKRKGHFRRVPQGARKPLSDRDVLIRLRDVWSVLSLRDGGRLTEADEEFINYNFALAQLYGNLRGLGTGGSSAIGFQVSGDEIAGGAGSDEDDGDGVQWYDGAAYCKSSRRGGKKET